jgi:acyl carrier protein
VELIMEFEERFGETVSDEDAQQLTTVGQVVEYVDTRMGADA